MQAGNRYDFLFAGGGLAGLSLAWHLEKAFPGQYSMLIADRTPKVSNDRTWCFWEKENGPFQDVVFRQWDHIRVEGPDWCKELNIAPYRYKMIRSKDLYEFIQKDLQHKPNIHFAYGDITRMQDLADGASFFLDEQECHGKWMINSAFRPTLPASYQRVLLQHFKGYFVHTEKQAFDPGVPLFMDFRVEQGKDVRFVYILPFTKQEALIEFTVFSPSVWPEEKYREELNQYIDTVANIGEYHILEEEFGIIPMSDFAYPTRTGKHILHAGTAGGATKASTGYTFVNVQQQNAGIVKNIRQHGHPFVEESAWRKRFRIYDGILLDVLVNHRYAGSDIFRILFHENSASDVLAFLAEETNFAHELKLFSTFPQLPFIKGFLQVMKTKVFPFLS